VRWQSGSHKLVEPGLLHPASDDDDNTFRLVDGKPPLRPKFSPKWLRMMSQEPLPEAKDDVKTLITLVVRPQFVNRHRSLCLKLRMMSTLRIRVEVAYTNRNFS
jgi:hypothetical protein